MTNGIDSRDSSRGCKDSDSSSNYMGNNIYIYSMDTSYNNNWDTNNDSSDTSNHNQAIANRKADMSSVWNMSSKASCLGSLVAGQQKACRLIPVLAIEALSIV